MAVPPPWASLPEILLLPIVYSCSQLTTLSTGPVKHAARGWACHYRSLALVLRASCAPAQSSSHAPIILRRRHPQHPIRLNLYAHMHGPGVLCCRASEQMCHGPWPTHARSVLSMLHHCSAWRSGVVDLCIVGPEATTGHQPTRFNVPSPRGRIRRRVPEELFADTNTLSRVLRRCNTTPRRSGLIARHFLDAAGRLQAAAPQPVHVRRQGLPQLQPPGSPAAP